MSDPSAAERVAAFKDSLGESGAEYGEYYWEQIEKAVMPLLDRLATLEQDKQRVEDERDKAASLAQFPMPPGGFEWVGAYRLSATGPTRLAAAVAAAMQAVTR